jgi:FkbM family methyltransferase
MESKKPRPRRAYEPEFPLGVKGYKTTPSSYKLYAQRKIINNMCSYLNSTLFPDKSVIVDCLANVGCDSMYLSTIFKKVYSLEPREEEYKSLEHNIELFQKNNHSNNITIKKTNLIQFINELDDKKSDEMKKIVFYINLEFTDHSDPPKIGDFDIRYPEKLKLEDLLKKIRESVSENYYIVIKHPRAFPIKKIHHVFGYKEGYRGNMVFTVSKEIDGCIASIVYVKPSKPTNDYIFNHTGYADANYNFRKLMTDNENGHLLYFQDMILVNEKKERINHFKLEIDEQMIVPKFIRGDDVVLEFGARYGSVSCMINNQLWDRKNHVCVEPDKTVWEALETNRKTNHCNFHILKGFVSNTKQKMVGLNAWDGYGARSIEATETNSGDPPSYTLDEVKKKYGLKFNVFVADCEGCLEKFFEENPHFYDELRLFIFERDYPETCNYPKIERELLKRGFKAVIKGHQNVYEREVNESEKRNNSSLQVQQRPRKNIKPKTRKNLPEQTTTTQQQRPRKNIKPKTRKNLPEQTTTTQQRPRKNIKPKTRKNLPEQTTTQQQRPRKNIKPKTRLITPAL